MNRLQQRLATVHKIADDARRNEVTVFRVRGHRLYVRTSLDSLFAEDESGGSFWPTGNPATIAGLQRAVRENRGSWKS